MTKGRNHWNPPRIALCTCGWSGTFTTLRITNDHVARHLAEGCEGCDHAAHIEDKEVAR